MRDRSSRRGLLAGLFAVAASCGGKAVVDGPASGATGGGSTCARGVCLGPEDAAELEATAVGLEACVPVADGADSEGLGLRVGGVEVLASSDVDVSLRLVLANLEPAYVPSYPGLRLEILRDWATVATLEAGQFYGIEGCGTMETTVTLGWDLVGGATFLLSATNQLGKIVTEAIQFSLER
ncbi:MAG: hypothetical protein FJ096_15755 [Deltaproteobacteria bacterium]|nr:hypothetical protein [Deltaproteobacteria bacterium]